MADLTLEIGARQYVLACREGDEGRLRALAAVVAAKVDEIRSRFPGVNESRQLLFAALLLADELDSRPPEAPPAPPAPDHLPELENLAIRLEKLALDLETPEMAS